MSHVASLELCKELYELSGWEEPGANRFQIEVTTGGIIKTGCYYSLGYLLRKLPDITITNSVADGSEPWHAGQYGYYDGIGWIYDAYADTPEDAAAKLAIELIRKGVIKL